MSQMFMYVQLGNAKGNKSCPLDELQNHGPDCDLWAVSLLEAENGTPATEGSCVDVCWKQATPGSGERAEVSPKCSCIKEFR